MEFKSFEIQKHLTLSARNGYREWSQSYEDSVEDTMDIRLLERIKSIAWKQIDSAIDLACGTGRIGVWLKRNEVKLIDGIDFTPEMLKQASKKGVYNELINGDILNTKLGKNSYGLSIEVLADEHLADLQPLYTEAARITKHPHFLMNGLITHFHRENGEMVAIKSFVHLLSDHVKAAFKANLKLIEMDEGIVDADWIDKKPKWLKYKDRPVSFVMVWKKG